MATGLYPRLLGPAWNELDVAVRRMHCDGAPVRARGRFRVRRGQRWLARGLLWLARMPPARDGVDLQLIVREDGPGEQWERSFEGWPFLTTQHARSDGLLAERAGGLELRFRLEAERGALVYRQVGTALCLGPLRLPLPRWLAPRVLARESPDGAANRSYVSVLVESPLFGFLISYEGSLETEEAKG